MVVCVRNRIGDETFEEARVQEALLFQSHPILSKIDKSIVGIPVLAQKLMHIQATTISKCLPDIVKKTKDKLNQSISDLDKMLTSLTSSNDAMSAFLKIVSSAKESLRNILVWGEYDDYRACWAEMPNQCNKELQSKSPENDYGEKFLLEEFMVLGETSGNRLPNFLPHRAFLILLKKLVNKVAEIPVEFMEKLWNYVEEVVVEKLEI